VASKIITPYCLQEYYLITLTHVL